MGRKTAADAGTASKYTVLTRVDDGETVYVAGDTIELTAGDAGELIDCGAIAAPAPAKPAKAAD